MDWLQRRRERARLKAIRTGDSPQKLAERKRKAGPPDELSIALTPEIVRKQAREKRSPR
jgi:hypothetical protein